MGEPARDMTKVEVTLPAGVVERLGGPASELPARVREAVVLHLFERGEISAGFAAETLGMDLRDFYALADRRGIALLRYDDDAREAAALRAIPLPRKT